MEAPGRINLAKRGGGRILSSRSCPHHGTYVLNWRSQSPTRHLFGIILITNFETFWLSDGGLPLRFRILFQAITGEVSADIDIFKQANAHVLFEVLCKSRSGQESLDGSTLRFCHLLQTTCRPLVWNMYKLLGDMQKDHTQM